MNRVRRKNLREQTNPDDYWMGLAFWIAAGSRNPTPQGAVVVGPQNNFLSWGYDSPPKCVYDHGEFLRPAEKVALDPKFVVFHGATIYITHTPAAESVLDIVAADIKRIVYFPTKPLDHNSQDIVQQAYGQIQEYRGNLSWMRDHLTVLKSLGVFS